MGTKQDEASLILKLYEIRRDEEFRKAREWFDTEFNPQSAEEIVEIFGSGFEGTRYLRMVLSHWEMVAALANHGAIDPQLLHATNVEHLRYYANRGGPRGGRLRLRAGAREAGPERPERREAARRVAKAQRELDRARRPNP
jgi:hypothetical protein